MCAEAASDHLERYHCWNTFSDEVLCLCICREQTVLTGHESKIKIWSWNSKLKTSKETTEVEVRGNVTYICQFPHDNVFAVSVHQDVLIYEYKVVDSMVISLSLKDQLCFNEDEINQIDIHPTKDWLICSCDDNGDVKVIDVNTKKITHTLTNFHDGICSAVKFCSKKPWELVSGGLDCTIGRWDFNRGRLLANLSTKQDASGTALFVNPPMVHSLDVFSAHHSLVCGLGDGRLVAYSLKVPKDIGFMCQVHAHLTSVASVHCVELGETSHNSALYIVSVGNDRVMCVHKLNRSGGGDSAVYDMLLMGKLCCTSKVNHVDVLYEANCVLIFTADVAGSVSVFVFKH